MMMRHCQPSTNQTLEGYLEHSTLNPFSEDPYGCELVASSIGVTQSHCHAEHGPGASSSHFPLLDQIPLHPQTLAPRLQSVSVPKPQPEYVTAIPGSSPRKRRGSKMTMFQPELGHEIKDRSEEHLADALVSAGVLETNHGEFVCNYCPMSFWVEREARNHVLMAHLYKLNILKRYRCRAVGCLFTSNVKSSAARHCDEQGKPKWICPLCGKSYLRKTYKHKCKGTNTAGRVTAFDQVAVQPQYGAQAFSESNREQICERKAASETCRCKHTGTNAAEPVPVIEQRDKQTVTERENVPEPSIHLRGFELKAHPMAPHFAFGAFFNNNLYGGPAHACS